MAGTAGSIGNMQSSSGGSSCTSPHVDVTASSVHHTLATPQPAPWTISEANNHCVGAFDRLRTQREQARFADLILSVQGREFPAHRCVLAACSPWFDSKLKVHKSIREHIAIDHCKDYEIFYALLTYCYTGHIVLDRHNVPELLHLSTYFSMAKLKSYCCEYLGRNLNVKNVHSVIDMALRYNLSDLIRQSFSFLQRNFTYLFEHDRAEMMHYSPAKVQAFLSDKAWSLPQELVLRFVACWVSFDVTNREECFVGFLYSINWNSVNPAFICEHLDKEELYHNSLDALFGVLTVVDRNSIYLSPKFQDIYQNLQERILPEQDLDELNDSNSFLSIAINSAVKDLEHSDVDTDWFLSEPNSSAGNQMQPAANNNSGGAMGPPPPPPPSSTSVPPSLPQPPVIHPIQSPPPVPSSLPPPPVVVHPIQSPPPTPVTSSLPPPPPTGVHPIQSPPPTPTVTSLPPPPTIHSTIQQPQPLPIQTAVPSQPVSTNHSVTVQPSSQSSSTSSSRMPETKYKDSFELEIFEQLINEQQQSEERSKYRDAASSVKRFDPKFRALTEAFRQMEEEETEEQQSRHNNKQDPMYPHPKQRHISCEQQVDYRKYSTPEVKEAAAKSSNVMPPNYNVPNVREGMHNMPARVPISHDLGLSCVDRNSQTSIDEGEPPPTVAATHPMADQDNDPPLSMKHDNNTYSSSNSNFETPSLMPDYEPLVSADFMVPMTSDQVVDQGKTSYGDNSKKEYRIDYQMESKKKLASKQNKKIPTEDVETNNSSSNNNSVVAEIEMPPQKQHVKKAKLLAEHRETLQRSNSIEKPLPVAKEVVPHEASSVTCKNSVKENTKRRVIKCIDCSYSTHLSARMRVHTRQHERASQPSSCPFCKFTSTWKVEMREHIRKEHVQGPPYNCTYSGCTYSTPKLHLFLNHRDIHTQNSQFACTVAGCSFTTTTIHRLKFHKISHSGQSFPCSHCDKRFASKNTLQTHQLVHVDEKPLKCKECDFTTKYRNHLATHMKIHRGDVLKCSMCSYSTPKPSLMLAHKRAHTKEKIFVCQTCSKSFVEKSQLTRHMKIHSDDMPFACSHCKFRTKRRDKLKNHLLKLHNVQHMP